MTLTVGERIGVIGIFVALIGSVVAITIPEARAVLGLPADNATLQHERERREAAERLSEEQRSARLSIELHAAQERQARVAAEQSAAQERQATARAQRLTEQEQSARQTAQRLAAQEAALRISAEAERNSERQARLAQETAAQKGARATSVASRGEVDVWAVASVENRTGRVVRLQTLLDGQWTSDYLKPDTTLGMTRRNSDILIRFLTRPDDPSTLREVLLVATVIEGREPLMTEATRYFFVFEEGALQLNRE